MSYRTFANGVKRAVTTPKRVIYIVFFFGYYFMIFIRPTFTPSASNLQISRGLLGRLPFPPLDVIDSLVFALFAVLSLFMIFSTSMYQAALRPADVDVLFPTPISPKVVMLFKIARDYFVTLLTPFLIALFGLQASMLGYKALFTKMPHPEYAGLTLRAMALSWVMMAMCFVAIAHAVSLSINRSDLKSDKNKRVFMVVLGSFFLTVGMGLPYWIWSHPGAENLLALGQSPILRVVFLLATFATDLTMAPLRGNLVLALCGLIGMSATIGISLHFLSRQIGWFYDQAAVRGFGSMKQRQLQRSGDYSAIVAERARTGKVRVVGLPWLLRLKMTRASALFWKELFLQPRTMLGVIITLTLLEVLISVSATFMTSNKTPDAAGYALISMQGFITLMFSLIVCQTGFIEVLKRIDLEKALPFKPGTIVFYEVLARSFIGGLASWAGAIAFLVVAPELWDFALATAIVMPGVSLLVSSTIFLVTIVFPDIEDPTQRQFRGLMIMLGFCVTGILPTLLFVLLAIAKVALPICAVLTLGLSIAISIALSVLSGSFYANFNPSE